MESFMAKAAKVDRILAKAPKPDGALRVEKPEFLARQRLVMEGLRALGVDCGFVYSGDVCYLGGCFSLPGEPVAGILGPQGFHILTGLEGVCVASALVHKVGMLTRPGVEYSAEAERVEDALAQAVGQMPRTIALLTPREALPVSVYKYLCSLVGEGNVVDCQRVLAKARYEKSDREIELTRQAALIADAMLEGMLAVLEPGMLETQVSQWGWLIGQALGAEGFGFDVTVTAGERNRALAGKSLNRVIREGDYVQLGVAPQCGGLTACERCTVVATLDPARLTDDQRYWIDFVEGAYYVGLEAYRRVAWENLPARFQEQALIGYFKNREEDVCRRIGRRIELARQKPFSGTRGGGCTAWEDVFGAITLKSDEPLGLQIVTLLDVAVRGTGAHWNDVVIPGLDSVRVEKTLAKMGAEVEVLNRLPANLQHLVGRVQE